MNKITPDADALCFAHLPAGGQIESLVGPDGDFGESLLTLADLLPHGKGELGILARKLPGTPMTVANADSAQLLGILDRNGAEANGVNELEDGGVGADAEGQGEDGNDGKTGTQAKKAKGVAKALPE